MGGASGRGKGPPLLSPVWLARNAFPPVVGAWRSEEGGVNGATPLSSIDGVSPPMNPQTLNSGVKSRKDVFLQTSYAKFLRFSSVMFRGKKEPLEALSVEDASLKERPVWNDTLRGILVALVKD
ncbi:unnamed protein product, partial [Strongylus vulgaris]